MKALHTKSAASREPIIIDAEFREVVPVAQRMRLDRTKAVILAASFTASAICVAAAFNLLTGPAAVVALFAIAGTLKLHELLKGGRHA
ncbi:hypothetical protein [Gulbenkiania mobilis]|uniref:hypothetical protein n=1 Tax=Gulbenkiania mobilis TaxID=397457 RepID=UPI0006BBA0B2|nr:hypothetical protein [Gulbenkiania mobilis]